MPIPDRSTIKAVVDALVAGFNTNLVSNPPTPTKPFRKLLTGDIGLVEYARPYIAVRLTKAKPLAATEDDKLMEVTVAIKLVTDVFESDPHNALLDKVAEVDNYFDSTRQLGLVDGAEGFDNRTWQFVYPPTRSGARVAYAESLQSYVVKVERDMNR